MKRINLKKAVTCIVFTVLSLALLASCGRYTRFDSSIKISAISLLGGDVLTLGVTGRNCDPGMLHLDGYVTFHSDNSMDELFASLQLEDVFTAQRQHDAILLKKQAGKTEEYYCISKAVGGYVFGGMMGKVIVDVTEQGKQYQTILLPVHLIQDELILNGDAPFYTLYANVDYKAHGDIKDFQDFYLDCGWYDVECAENNIFVNGWKQDNQAMKSALNYDTLETDVPFIVRLTLKDDGLYFAILTN